MKTVKKIVAWILLIFAIIGILVAVAGIAGSWVVNSKVTNVTLNLLTAGQEAVTAVSNSVNRVDDRLDVTQERIDSIDDRVMNAGDELKETSLVVELVDRMIGDELRPIIQSISDTVIMIQDTATAVDEVIQAVDDIPLVSVKRITPGENIFTQIADDITAIGVAIDDTQAEIQGKREGKIEDVVGTVTGKTDEWRTSVGGVQGKLNDADGRLDETYNNLDELKITLPRTFLMITLAVNLLFIIMGIAFVSLVFHSLSYIKNSEQTLSELLA